MKKTIILLLSMLLATLLHAQVSETVNLTTAGTLATSTVNSLADITNLTVTGTIDASDFQTMRDNMPVLSVLDLGGASVDGDFIPATAFYNATSLTGKTSLTSVVLPASTVIIGKQAFRGCTALKTVNMQQVTTLGDYAFYGCGFTSLTVPASVTSMGVYAFSSCTQLQDVTVPGTVPAIADYAFQNCSALSTLTLNEGLKSIGQYAFNGCNVLSSVTIPGTVTYIGQFAFYYCTGLKKLTFVEGAIKGAMTISSGAFYNCTGLTGTLVIPSSVGYIADGSYYYPCPSCNGGFVSTFGYCSNLTGLTLAEGVTYIGSYAFNGCPGIGGTVTIPSTVITISSYAFGGSSSTGSSCTGITGLVLSNGVTTIKDYAFLGCTSIKGTLTIPPSVTTIGWSAFQNCNMLTSLVIPASVTSISGSAFDAISFSTIKVYGKVPLSIDASVFTQVDKSACLLYVPYGTKAAYQAAAVWNSFANIMEMKGFTLAATTASLAATAGGNASVGITTNTTCTATSDQSWLTISPASVTSGTGTLSFTALANPTTVARTATVTVKATGADPQTITVIQAAGPATLSLSATTARLAKDAGSADSVTVNCNTTWSATSSQAWLTLNKTSGSDTSVLAFTAAVNPTIVARAAVISVSATGVTGSQTITVTQSAGDTVLTVSKTAIAVVAGASNTATASITSNTLWEASSDQSWVTISPATATTGNATLTFTVAASTQLTARTAIVALKATGAATQTITITQDAFVPTLSLSAASATVASAANSTATVTVTSNTAWTAGADQSWVSISPATATSGNKTLTFTVTENQTIVARTAVVTVSATGVTDKTFTITQAAGAAVLSAVSTQSMDATASGVNVAVTSNTTWTASSGQSWLTVSPTSATIGNGTLVLTASENKTITARTAAVTFSAIGVTAAKIITVTQAAGAATLGVSATTATLAKTAGSKSSVTVLSNSPWTAVSDQSWLTLDKTTGTDTADLTFTATVNPTIGTRTAVITFKATGAGNQTVTVTQAAGDTILTVSATTAGFTSDGSAVAVTITSNTLWDASSDQSWLTVSPQSGAAYATAVTITASANTGATRTAKVTISATGVASQIVTVTQDAFVAVLSVSANSVNLAATPDTAKVTLNSNITWSATSDQSWLTVIPNIATTGNKTLTLAATANTGAARNATVTISGTGVGSQTITVTQALFVPIVSAATSAVKYPAAGGWAGVAVTANTSWTATSSDGWLTVTQTTKSIGLTATLNTGALRTATVSITATGMASQTITVTQSDSIIIAKQIADTSFALGTLANKYIYAGYFKYPGTGTLTYSVSSDNPGVVSPVNLGTSFGLVQYGKGTAGITVRATATSGAVAVLTFKVTVTSTATVNCATLAVSSQITNIKCNGEKTGSVELTVTGGMKPYNYKWSNTFSDNFITNLEAGSYSVIVTDSNLCSVQKTYTITAASSLALNAAITAPTCSLSNGNIALSVTGGTSPYSYKWNDGTTATALSSKPAGQYAITITDNAGCTQTESFDLSNTNAPTVSLDSTVSSQCTNSNGKIAISVTGGTTPYTFNWNDGVTTEDRTAVSSGSYSLTVNDAAGCKTMFKAVVSSQSFAQPSIALVTVSDSTGKNLIVWQKENTDAIKEYTIYRENEKAGIYEKLDNVSYTATSIYKDATASSQEQSWRYKISATDYCGNESPMSVEHKTIHLQKNIGLSKEINLDWDAYEGLNFFTYIIYRQSKLKGLEELKRIPSSITRYTDLTPPADVKSYYVGIELPDTIYPSRLKSDSGPFSQSLSNMAESDLTNVAMEGVEQWTLSPNPTNDFAVVTVASQQPFSVDVVDVLGRVVIKQSGRSSTKLDCTALHGIYFVKIQSGDTVKTKTLVVE